jgi:hypothetical protein
MIGTNREPEVVVATSLAARAGASNRSKKISANMTEPPQGALEHERIICKVLGGQLLCACHHFERVNLNRCRSGNTGLRV